MGFKFATTQVSGCPIRLFSQSNYRSMFGQIIGGGGIMSRSYLGLFWLVIEYGTTVSGYVWCHICTDLTKNDHWISVFTVLCYFLK